jgi:hypothetical protein
MTRNTTHSAGSNTGINTPEKETAVSPVLPLETEPGDAGPSSGSPSSLQTCSTPQRLETVMDESEEDENSPGDSRSLSEQDEALSEGASSYEEDPQFSGPPNLQDLVRLGPEHCRSPCRMTDKEGVKTSSSCGKTAKDCKLHAKVRLGADSYQYATGFYLRVPVARGFEGHGLAGGPFYTDSQIQAFRKAEEKEMGISVGTLNKDTANEDGMDELVRDIRVQFEPQKPSPESTKRSDSADALRKALAANTTGGPTRKKESSPPPSMWFGLIGTRHGVKWITADAMEAHRAATKKQCKIHQVYSTREEAEARLEEEDSDETASGHLPGSQKTDELDDDSSVPDRVAQRQAKNKARRARKKQQMKEAKKSKDLKEEKAKKIY